MNSQPTTKEKDCKGYLYFNNNNLSWFGLDRVRDNMHNASYTVSPFIGWGNDDIPDIIKLKPVPEAEMLNRYNNKIAVICGRPTVKI